MSRDEVKIAEAIASLTARLEGWGVEGSAAKAHEYVNDMLRQGWRPRSLAVAPPPRPQVCAAPPADVVSALRLQLAEARATFEPAPDRRPFVPPTPKTPAERVQGEAGEVALEPCDSCGAGRNEPCCDGCSEDVDCRSFR